MTVTSFTLGKITIKRFNYWPNQAKDYCYLATIKDVTFFLFSLFIFSGKSSSSSFSRIFKIAMQHSECGL